MERSNEELKKMGIEIEQKLLKAEEKIQAYEFLMNDYTKQVFEIYNESKDYNDFRCIFINSFVNPRFEIEKGLNKE